MTYASFVGIDSVENETTLSIVQESEVFLGLLNANNICIVYQLGCLWFKLKPQK